MTMRDGWVDVRERLPEEGSIARVHTALSETIRARYEGGQWVASDGYVLDLVTHWQPIEGPLIKGSRYRVTWYGGNSGEYVYGGGASFMVVRQPSVVVGSVRDAREIEPIEGPGE